MKILWLAAYVIIIPPENSILHAYFIFIRRQDLRASSLESQICTLSQEYFRLLLLMLLCLFVILALIRDLEAV